MVTSRTSVVCALLVGLSACVGAAGSGDPGESEAAATAAPKPTEDVVVASVTDGDTVSVLRAGEQKPVRIRLLSIDAPETKHGAQADQDPWATASMLELQRLLPEGTRVTLQTPGIDVHKRFLSRILRHAEGDPKGGLDINLELVRLGAAFPFAFCRPTSPCTLSDLRQANAPAFAKACLEAKSAKRPGGIFDPRKVLKETPYELRDRAWERQKEIVWFGDLLTGKYVGYEARETIDVCNRVAFALTTVNGRVEEPIPSPGALGSPERSGFEPLR